MLLLLPVFFIDHRASVNIRGIGLDAIGRAGGHLLVACRGKFVGCGRPRRALQGIARRARRSAIGILMNTRVASPSSSS